ncbi:MAG: ABC transporter permease [Anaerolineales bacterium]|nr:ABC transporter permease [Anaerolineales bacterium]
MSARRNKKNKKYLIITVVITVEYNKFELGNNYLMNQVVFQEKNIEDQKSTQIIFDTSNLGLIEYIRKNIKSLHNSRYALYFFVKNSLFYRYRRSNLGFLWNLLNPLLMMVVMGAAFAMVFQRDIKSYMIYLFAGLAPFQFLNSAIVSACMSMVTNEKFIKKVSLPKIFFPLVSVTIEFVNFIFMIISLYIVALFIGAKFHSAIFLLPVAFLILFIFSFASGTILSICYVYFRDLGNILNVIFRAFFYITPILYPEDRVPPSLHMIFKLNPLNYYVYLVKHLILGDLTLTTTDWIIPTLMAIVLMIIGLVFLMKMDRNIVYRL